jgi:DNA-binding XRE family transcriptional regulator
MIARNVTMNGKQYVLVPRRQWEALTRNRGAKGGLVKMPPPLRDGSFTLQHVRISLASKMSARRKAVGLTQAQLARLARVRVETISRLENGLHMPSIRTFDRIERALSRSAKRPAA